MYTREQKCLIILQEATQGKNRALGLASAADTHGADFSKFISIP